MVTPLRPARFGAGRQMRSESAVRRIGVAEFGGEEELVGRPGGEVERQGIDDDLGERHPPEEKPGTPGIWLPVDRGGIQSGARRSAPSQPSSRGTALWTRHWSTDATAPY